MSGAGWPAFANVNVRSRQFKTATMAVTIRSRLREYATAFATDSTSDGCGFFWILDRTAARTISIVSAADSP